MLARAVAARSSTGTSVLQRVYHVYDATAGTWEQITDASTELDALNQEVASNAALADIKAKWQARRRADRSIPSNA